jgi:hypothetical protein
MFTPTKPVIANKYWYDDGPPLLKASFSAANTAERQAEVVGLLSKGSPKQSRKQEQSCRGWEASSPAEAIGNQT